MPSRCESSLRGGELAETGLDRDQLADQVDQLVELLRVHPQARHFAAPAFAAQFLDPLLFRQGRVDPVAVHQTGRDQRFAEALALLQHLVEIRAGQIAAFDQDFAEALVLLRVFRPTLLVDQGDGETAAVLDEDEDVADGVDIGGGGQDQVPEEIALLGIEGFEGGNLAGLDHRETVAEGVEFAQEAKGIEAALEDVGGRIEADPVGAQFTACRSPRGLKSLCSGRLPEGELLNPGHQAGHVGTLVPFSGGQGDQGPELVEGLQGEIDQFGADREPTGPHLLENGLHLVGDGGDVLESEHRPRPLEGVQGAKDGVDPGRVFGRPFQDQQGAFELFQQLAGLVDEDPPLDAAHTRTMRTRPSNCSGLKGLVSQAEAPAALPWRRFSSWDSVVSITTGMKRQPGSLRNRSIRLIPSMRGMFRSVIIMSTLWAWLVKSPIASRPSSASSTS